MPPGLPTTLKRPEEKAIPSFKPWMIGEDTIAALLDNGSSLGICCRHCGRTIEMKPEAIEDKFGVAGTPPSTTIGCLGKRLRLQGRG